MATRRTNKSHFAVPIPNGSTNTTTTSKSPQKQQPQIPTITTLDAPPPLNSPLLPTPLETLLLSLYPSALLLGSLFSYLQPSSRRATYLPHHQAYDPSTAPSYFAKKSNVFNLYFVKIGWFWTTLAFFLLILSHPAFGPAWRLKLTKRRLHATARYAVITLVWVLVTQWCFGPPVIDRSFRWTGGQCALVQAEDVEDEMGKARQVVTHAACKAIGGQWSGGHDISGHVFLLILGSAMLWAEFLPTVFPSVPGLTSARRIVTPDGLVRSANVERESPPPSASFSTNDAPPEQSVGVTATVIVAGLSSWMLLMTAAYFHTWFEKFTGLLVAFGTIYIVYFLPRGVAALRQMVGMPGV